MTNGNRPLSPHLLIYRPQITSVLSIVHRATGVFLGLGAVLFAYWLNAAAYGDEAFARVQAGLAHPLGRLFLFGWTLALFFHLCNGVRHLFWDAGWGFEMDALRTSGVAVLLVSLFLTVVAWLAGYGLLGAG